jgi:hypothetical protein
MNRRLKRWRQKCIAIRLFEIDHHLVSGLPTMRELHVKNLEFACNHKSALQLGGAVSDANLVKRRGRCHVNFYCLLTTMQLQVVRASLGEETTGSFQAET